MPKLLDGALDNSICVLKSINSLRVSGLKFPNVSEQELSRFDVHVHRGERLSISFWSCGHQKWLRTSLTKSWSAQHTFQSRNNDIWRDWITFVFWRRTRSRQWLRQQQFFRDRRNRPIFIELIKAQFQMLWQCLSQYIRKCKFRIPRADLNFNQN